MALKTDIDDFHVQGREVYWLCRRKQSESTFSNAMLEKAIGRINPARVQYDPEDGREVCRAVKAAHVDHATRISSS